MKFWRWLRNLDRILALETALANQVRESGENAEHRISAEEELERERTRRIGAEALSAERHSAIDDYRKEIEFLRGEVQRIYSERLKSLDSLNLKLMEPRTEAPPPDIAQFRKEAQIQLGKQALRHIRDFDRGIDAALLGTLHPGFKHPAGASMNESAKTAVENGMNEAMETKQ